MKRLLKVGCMGLFGVVLLLTVLALFAGPATETQVVRELQPETLETPEAQNTPEALDVSVWATAAPEIPETPVPVEPTDMPTATPEPTPVPGIGQDVVVGDVRWTVLAVDTLGSVLQDEWSDPVTTRGMFVQVRIDIENLGTDLRSYSGATLTDSQGRTFVESSDAMWFIPEGEQSVLVTNLNPNVPKTITSIYDIPADAMGLTLTVDNLRMFGRETAVISLGF